MRNLLNYLIIPCMLIGLTVALLSCGKDEPAADPVSAEEKPAPVAEPAEAAALPGEQVESWGYLPDDFDADSEEREPAPLEIVGGFEQSIGDLFENEKRALTFVLKNTSDTAWRIQTIDANCSCTNIEGIPGGLDLPPHGQWEMLVRVDAEKISAGDFEREIIIRPLKYKQVRLKIRGRVVQYAHTLPVNRILKFNDCSDPTDKWETSAEISGLGGLEGKIKLAVTEKTAQDQDIACNLEETAPGIWELTCVPKRPLPYNDLYTHTVSVKILNENGRYPDLNFVIRGRIGLTLNYSPRRVKLQPEDFDAEGHAKFAVSLGFDPAADARKAQSLKTAQKLAKLHDKFVGNVNWKALFANFKVEGLPEGVTATPVFTRFGVRLDVDVARSVFADESKFVIHTSAYGNPFTPIPVNYKSVPSEENDDE